ncbi:TPA: hypothetical protein ACXDAY_002243 [Clostridium botulinum]|uniref:hypothetical protein n=1 Tax=Clostridium botulinum TaxID=1491 RepID=UPI0004B8819B|nr:hypothetical protein [Clostridium botulinum]APH20992.1 hypothetical protein NPD1_4128 [Clostridium botulinum]APQ71124.1 hypothetical protein RSJ8_4085 [Clostridium botulinum]AUN01467.1 hypothetical protein RSJ19_00350 [Clostridium botulinum]MBN3359193.1 hypothetical protein [Clostridium botulinum]MBN3379062.1 hypothetical protein [Clostridium botulinum]
MKKVKIIMNSGKEYTYKSSEKDCTIADFLDIVLDEKGVPKNRIVILQSEGLAINPVTISSLEQL